METKRENENKERLRELTAKIATEQDPEQIYAACKGVESSSGREGLAETDIPLIPKRRTAFDCVFP